jgi:predicted DnaQ family exonuclease/DinG family helicase
MSTGPLPQIPLLPRQASPIEDTWVALDLETTGLSPDGDEIIEVGAIKFQGEEELDSYTTLVNPYRSLDSFVRRYTGISQDDVDGAPPFSEVAPRLAAFIGSAPVVGHNISFDLDFLRSGGLPLPNPRADTWDMAFVLLPLLRDYSLLKLARALGIEHPRPHRAMEDASVTRDVFLRLFDMAAEMDVFALAEMERLASRSSWILAYLFRRLNQYRLSQGPSASSGAGVTGIDVRALRGRLHGGRSLRPHRTVATVDPDEVAAVLSADGPMSRAVSGFEERPEQIEMARSVARAIGEGRRLMVEAGTGVGKSLAYLVPAALYALKNNVRVVVSTNTINLQEQLLTKDIPDVVKALEEVEGMSSEDLHATLLKGRANYLCLQRWGHVRSGEGLSEDDARMLAKALTWLGETSTGDRSELNLGRGGVAAWDRLSAQGAADCQGMNGVCFLRAARERAAAAHIVVVNHALLIADLAAGRALIPDYDVLIVDEAHHLEEVATKQLGFEISQAAIDERLQLLGGDRGLVGAAVTALRGSLAAQTRRETIEEVAAKIAGSLPGIRDSVAALFSALARVVGGQSGDGREMRVTAATRAQPGWSELEVRWEDANALMGELERDLLALDSALDGLEEAAVEYYEGLVSETRNAIQEQMELRTHLAEFIPKPQDDGIYWVSTHRRTGDLSLNSAPIHVGEQLDKLLFSQKEAVVLTGATLSANGTFDHMRDRTGFADNDELLLGSPFDYPRAALVYVPTDMPEPSSWAYQGAVEHAVVDAATAAEGRTMALFTSHAALQETARAVRGGLQSHDIQVLAQGLDGPPHRLVEEFLDNPRSVLLGTASFWEGVDLAGDALSVLIIARLPFAVPTEPVFAARSELFDNPFEEYAVPHAIIRTRQGFGRLIRTSSDRGVAVFLDRRVVSRRYGDAFLNSLPPATRRQGRLRDLSEHIGAWLKTTDQGPESEIRQ